MTALGLGERIPRFTAPDQSGYLWGHDDLMGRRTVLSFLPSPRPDHGTPVVRNLQEQLAAFEALETNVFAVSPENVESVARFVATHGLTFPVLSDANGRLARGFGLFAGGRVPATTVLIGPSGRVQHVYTPAEPRLHVLEIMRDILALVRPTEGRIDVRSRLPQV